ncbi:unnamed protein product, partial [Scytosiphon promiscuus]
REGTALLLCGSPDGARRGDGETGAWAHAPSRSCGPCAPFAWSTAQLARPLSRPFSTAATAATAKGRPQRRRRRTTMAGEIKAPGPLIRAQRFLRSASTHTCHRRRRRLPSCR